ncbi:nuclear cap-binding protein subunit 3-like [Lineus longissimus]|uniref:nuclear cap-binding protein subunit 3-like n=1 Tax=Lineus longissimus TaxID=88925 RepID=UPI002B4E3A83
MATAMKKLPNLKICVENTDDLSESEDEIVVEDEDDLREDGEIDDSTDESGDEVQFSVSIRDAPSGTKSMFRGEKKYENRSGDFVTGFDITSKEYQERKAKRAKRFGIEHEVAAVSQEDLNSLYESLGITEESMSKGERGIRPEAIHIRGVENMSTQDVFAYFTEYAPGNIEWIDDSSCNVVWLDPMTAARAMINMSRSYLQQWKKEEKPGEDVLSKPVQAVDNDDDDLNLMTDDEEKENKATSKSSIEPVIDAETGEVRPEDIRARLGGDAMETNQDTPTKEPNESELSDYTSNDEDDDSDVVKRRRKKLLPSPEKDMQPVADAHTDEPVPRLSKPEETSDEVDLKPPGKWRAGLKSHPKANNLFLRFASKADRKMPGAERRSKYYQKHGNPNYKGMVGLISDSRKRKLRTEDRRKQSHEAREAISKAKAKEDEPKEVRPAFPKSDWLYNVAEELYDDQRLIDLDAPKIDQEKLRQESLRQEKEETMRLRMDEIQQRKRQRSPDRPALRMDDPKIHRRGLPKPTFLEEEEEDSDSSSGSSSSSSSSSSSDSDSTDVRVPVLPVIDGESSEEEDLSLLIPAKKRMTMKMYADEEEKKLTKPSYKSGATKGNDARARIQNLKRERELQSRESETTRSSANDLRRKLEGRRKNTSNRFKDYPSLVVEVFDGDDD